MSEEDELEDEGVLDLTDGDDDDMDDEDDEDELLAEGFGVEDESL